MTPLAPHEVASRLQDVASQMGGSLSAGAAESLRLFGELFLAWNVRINLGGARDMETLIGEHFVDALAAERFVREGASVVDVGSGGGLPGLPLAILCPASTFTLVEPRSKRVAFLRTAIRTLGLGGRVAVAQDRLSPDEASPTQLAADGFSVALSRATWSPDEWLALGKRLAPRVLTFTTTGVLPRLPPPSAELHYGKNRVLCVFDLR